MLYLHSNNDSRPHMSKWSDENGQTYRTFHSTLDFRWTVTHQETSTVENWRKVAHLDCDAHGNHTGTKWFPSRRV